MDERTAPASDRMPPVRVTDDLAGARIELRQLRYFVAVAEELHFGRAAAREHIAPSVLSSQLRRLERALGVMLVDRGGRRVELTAAGARFLIEVRDILRRLGRAAVAAQGLASEPPALRVGVPEEGYEAVRPVLRALRSRHPDLRVDQVSAGVPEQCRLLADGRLDVGVGRAPGATAAIASELFRLDPMGVLVAEDHPMAGRPTATVAALAEETLLFADEDRAPELNAFVAEVCRGAGFFPRTFPGTVQDPRAAVDLVARGCCVLCVPASAVTTAPGVVWRPLASPVPRYPWSLLWRAQQPSRHAVAMVSVARRLSADNGWRARTAELAG
ncbi:LysR family transcriptional regulator [Mangrovihabitans endophyticus]|uniref:LysR family transcriptional regulator n=1 Tax=Mangrovihabitans endophyticus TaxID=1751298 RepID=A0A8J3FQE5_9ACTN|nr:LysR substrate-binding domain-containing protein [Mangrovihabitans endophyticus]GGL08925.1 LysR family transcriptional regulator [Mangrovihabitans endophyticus]